MTFDYMQRLMAENFIIMDKWGTFASQRDIEPEISKHNEDLQHAYEELKRYYDSNLLSILFAPLFPSKSRNVIWHLKMI
jgi:hypothetical protein